MFKKWLREELCAEIKDNDIDNEQLEEIEKQWAEQKILELRSSENIAKKYSRSVICRRKILNYIVLMS